MNRYCHQDDKDQLDRIEKMLIEILNQVIKL